MTGSSFSGKAKGLLCNHQELNEAIVPGAVQRVRPKVMTVACAFFGLVPIMWSTGADAGTEGFGLGLALVSEAVRWHGGSVDVADRAGGGSTFRVRFPAIDTAVAEAV